MARPGNCLVWYARSHLSDRVVVDALPRWYEDYREESARHCGHCRHQPITGNREGDMICPLPYTEIVIRSIKWCLNI